MLTVNPTRVCRFRGNGLNRGGARVRAGSHSAGPLEPERTASCGALALSPAFVQLPDQSTGERRPEDGTHLPAAGRQPGARPELAEHRAARRVGPAPPEALD